MYTSLNREKQLVKSLRLAAAATFFFWGPAVSDFEQSQSIIDRHVAAHGIYKMH